MVICVGKRIVEKFTLAKLERDIERESERERERGAKSYEKDMSCVFNFEFGRHDPLVKGRQRTNEAYLKVNKNNKQLRYNFIIKSIVENEFTPKIKGERTKLDASFILL